jgi:putative SOS response-associated peptidase YedK
MSDERPLFAFAGIWCIWHGTRGTQKAPERGEHLLLWLSHHRREWRGGALHAKAMPVILRTAEECDAWLTAEPAEALAMQRPLPTDV